MKITIDTKEDSHEDIRKVMQILNHFSGNTPAPEPADTTNMMNMFSEEKKEETPMTMFNSEKKEETAPNFNSFLNLTEKKEDKEEPKIELF